MGLDPRGASRSSRPASSSGGLTTKNDLDDTQNQVDSLESQVQQRQETGASFVTAAKSAFDDLTQELGATSEGDDVKAQAQQVGDQLNGITDECRAALAGA